MSLPTLGLLTCPRFRHDHDVFQLQKVFEFGSLLSRNVALVNAFQEFSHALLNTFGGAESNNGFRR